ncbi:MAG: aspartate--tRNA ligase [Parvularculales bacterium]
MQRYRTHHCSALDKSAVGETVRLSGWVHRKRDHGGLLFIDLRDHYGMTQCVFDPDSEAFRFAEGVRSEYVISVEGCVVERTEETINPALPTGEVEVYVQTLEVLSEAADLPLPIFGEPDYAEDIRLRYRYLDLRRETLHSNIVLRSKIITAIRRLMTEAGFMEYQTPILTASSPEGARDFLVPSRLHAGRFYALPQAPQQFKQLIMMAGFDRYFQVAPCFRDEDARADRSPGEFYQLDIEMSFVEQEDVFRAVEPVLMELFREFGGGRRIVSPFPCIGWHEAMLKYGTDKPDLRNPIEIVDVTDIFAADEVSFRAFRSVIDKGGVVRAIPAPGVAGRPRSFFDGLNGWAQQEMNAVGLGYVIFETDVETATLTGKGPIAKFIPPQYQEILVKRSGIQSGDALFFACDMKPVATSLAGAARQRIAEKLSLIDEMQFAFCWIVDFPLYEWNETASKIDFSHNPFSMPQGGLEALTTKNPLEILGYQYDIVCNGVELSSGAIRNHSPEIMYRAFEIAGYDKDAVDRQFGGMINALRYGTPPHGGIAPGIDRIVMLLAGAQNLREVIMFPMNQQAEDLMMQSPSEVSEQQLCDLHIRLAPLPAKKDKDEGK